MHYRTVDDGDITMRSLVRVVRGYYGA
jgi:hypothetical protein